MFESYAEWMSTTDVCEALSVEKHAVYQLIIEGEVKAIKLNQNYRISRDSLIEYVLRQSGIEVSKEELYDYI